jgi:hypothetical protein
MDQSKQLSDIYAALDAIGDELRAMRRHSSELNDKLTEIILMWLAER